MSRHKESLFQRKLVDSSTFSSLSCLLGVFCCEHHRPAGLSNVFILFHHGFLRLLGSFSGFPFLACGFITGKRGDFVKPFSSASLSRFHVGPSRRPLPALCWLQRSRGPERRLRLPLRHSLHHLCATQPVPPPLSNALPSALRLFSLYENHISERLGEELHLTHNRTKASSFYPTCMKFPSLRPSHTSDPGPAPVVHCPLLAAPSLNKLCAAVVTFICTYVFI